MYSEFTEDARFQQLRWKRPCDVELCKYAILHTEAVRTREKTHLRLDGGFKKGS